MSKVQLETYGGDSLTIFPITTDSSTEYKLDGINKLEIKGLVSVSVDQDRNDSRVYADGGLYSSDTSLRAKNGTIEIIGKNADIKGLLEGYTVSSAEDIGGVGEDKVTKRSGYQTTTSESADVMIALRELQTGRDGSKTVFNASVRRFYKAKVTNVSDAIAHSGDGDTARVTITFVAGTRNIDGKIEGFVDFLSDGTDGSRSKCLSESTTEIAKIVGI